MHITFEMSYSQALMPAGIGLQVKNCTDFQMKDGHF